MCKRFNLLFVISTQIFYFKKIDFAKIATVAKKRGFLSIKIFEIKKDLIFKRFVFCLVYIIGCFV